MADTLTNPFVSATQEYENSVLGLSCQQGRASNGGEESWNLHTDAEDVVYGATLGTDMCAGAAGESEVQQIWSPLQRLTSITHCEIVAVLLSLEQELISARLEGYHGRLLLHIDNMAAFYILNNMVSSSPSLMVELRRLH